MSITKGLVIGAGQMGAGIAQVLAVSGVSVTLLDENKAQLDKAIKGISASLQKLLEKDKISSTLMDESLSRIKTTGAINESLDDDLIIEAIVENLEVKKNLFQSLAPKIRKGAIIGTNTSSLSITSIASSCPEPDRVIGMHFMNPVPLMTLVEIIRGLQTSDDTYTTIVELTKKLNKTPISAVKDYPGFIVNRILVPMINEAFYVLMEGIASPEDIDEAMKLGTNQPMGPLALADFVGLDTCFYICETFHRELGEDKYRPCPLLRKYVEAGWYGRKSGRGVYSY